MLEHSFSRHPCSLEHLFPWWNFRSQDHSFPGAFVPWTVRSRELSFPRTNKPWRPFPPRTIRSVDRLFPGTFVPGTLDLSCRGPFVHLSLVRLQRRNSITNRSVCLWQWLCTAANTQTVDRRYSASRLNRFSSSEHSLLNNSFGALQPSLYIHY